MRYEFTLQLMGYSEITDKIEDDIFSADCADALLHSRGDSVYLDFSREAMNSEEAINSAMVALDRAGYKTVLVGEHKLIN